MNIKPFLTVAWVVLLTACAALPPAPSTTPRPGDADAQAERVEPREPEPAAEAAIDTLKAASSASELDPELALALLMPLPTYELERLLSEHRQDAALAPWVDLALSARPYLLDDAALEPALAEWARRWPRAGYNARSAREWITAWRDVIEWPRHIAVLLPGSGALLDAGNAVRDGMMARWMELPQATRPKLEFIELGAHAEAAAGAWFQAREQGADFIIGPLDRSQVDALVALPDPATPVLLLNQPTSNTLPAEASGSYFVLALPPEEEAELAATRALVLEQRRAIVLEQDSTWGARVADAFVRFFEAGDGQVLDRRRYSRGEADYSDLFRDALGADESAARARQLQSVLNRPIEFEPVQRSDVDFLFLAGRGQDLQTIMPHLAHAGAGNLPVYGTSALFDGLRHASASEMEGLEMPLAPWFIPDTPEGRQGQQARRQYPDLSNPVFSQLHAMGRDAISLVPWLNTMHKDERLYLPGMIGRLHLDPDGHLERDLPWVRLERGVPIMN